MREKNYISAGIVTFNPDINRLYENISSICVQVGKVYIFDNGSSNISEIKEICKDESLSVQLITSNCNKGIAYALNRLFETAETDGFEWLLTLDQDSVCYTNIIEIYRPYLGSAESLSSLRKDRNIVEDKNDDGSTHLVSRCITSGNLVKVSAWKAVKGFNERLFIDMVDVDFCYRLRDAGFRIMQIERYGFLHELGDGSRISIFGREHFVGNYSAFRKYYIARNMTYVIRKYHLRGQYYSYKRLVLLLYSVIVKEEDKVNRIQSLLVGFKDGFSKFKYLDGYFVESEDHVRVNR